MGQLGLEENWTDKKYFQLNSTPVYTIFMLSFAGLFCPPSAVHCPFGGFCRGKNTEEHIGGIQNDAVNPEDPGPVI
jgi:hypothetical protein